MIWFASAMVIGQFGIAVLYAVRAEYKLASLAALYGIANILIFLVKK